MSYSTLYKAQNLYYPFGSVLEKRTYVTSTAVENYGYGFNGQEKDEKVSGNGNSLTAEFWQYDTRLGRRWNLDPVFKEHESPYVCFGNNPIFLSDLYGADLINGRKHLNTFFMKNHGTQVGIRVGGAAIATFTGGTAYAAADKIASLYGLAMDIYTGNVTNDLLDLWEKHNKARHQQGTKKWVYKQGVMMPIIGTWKPLKK